MDYSDRRPFACDICNFRFTSKQFLQRHLTVHTNERKYKCELCSRAYKYRKGLNRHYKKFHDQFYQNTIGNNLSNVHTRIKKIKKEFIKEEIEESEENILYCNLEEISDSFIYAYKEEETNEVKPSNSSKIFITTPYPSV